MFGMGMMEMLIILVVVVLLFGAGRLQGVGKGLGDGIRSFKEAVKGDDEASTPKEAGKKIDPS